MTKAKAIIYDSEFAILIDAAKNHNLTKSQLVIYMIIKLNWRKENSISVMLQNKITKYTGFKRNNIRKITNKLEKLNLIKKKTLYQDSKTYVKYQYKKYDGQFKMFTLKDILKIHVSEVLDIYSALAFLMATRYSRNNKLQLTHKNIAEVFPDQRRRFKHSVAKLAKYTEIIILIDDEEHSLVDLESSLWALLIKSGLKLPREEAPDASSRGNTHPPVVNYNERRHQMHPLVVIPSSRGNIHDDQNYHERRVPPLQKLPREEGTPPSKITTRGGYNLPREEAPSDGIFSEGTLRDKNPRKKNQDNQTQMESRARGLDGLSDSDINSSLESDISLLRQWMHNHRFYLDQDISDESLDYWLNKITSHDGVMKGVSRESVIKKLNIHSEIINHNLAAEYYQNNSTKISMHSIAKIGIDEYLKPINENRLQYEKHDPVINAYVDHGLLVDHVWMEYYGVWNYGADKEWNQNHSNLDQIEADKDLMSKPEVQDLVLEFMTKHGAVFRSEEYTSRYKNHAPWSLEEWVVI